MNREKVYFKSLKYIFYIFLFLNTFNIFKAVEDFNYKNLTEDFSLEERFFEDPTKGDIYVYVDSSELDYYDENFPEIGISIYGSGGGLAYTFGVNPANEKNKIARIENIQQDKYKILVDTKSIINPTGGNITVSYLPQGGYLDLKKNAVNFYVVKFKNSLYNPVDPVINKSSISFKLNTVEESSLFLNLQINGTLKNNSNGNIQNFKIGLNETKNFVDLNPNVSYTISLKGIGSPKDGVFYDPVSITTEFLKSGVTEQVNLSYGKKKNTTDLNKIPFTVTGLSGNLLSLQKINFIENSNNYDLISNYLDSVDFYFLKGKQFSIDATVPKDYKIAYSKTLIDDSTNAINLTYSTLTDPTKANLKIILAPVEEESFSNLDINGKLINNSFETINFKIKAGGSAEIKSLDTSKTYSLQISAIGDPLLGIYYSQITDIGFTLNAGDNVKNFTYALRNTRSNLFTTNFTLGTNDLTPSLISLEKINFFDPNNNTQYIESNLFNNSVLNNFKFLDSESVYYSITLPKNYDLILNGTHEINSANKDLIISFKSNLPPVQKDASIILKLNSLNDGVANFSNLNITGKIKNSDGSDVKTFSIKSGGNITINDLKEGSIYTIQVQGLGDAGNAIYYNPINYATTQLKAGINNVTIDYGKKIELSNLNKVSFNITGDSSVNLGLQKIYFTDNNSQYLYSDSSLIQALINYNYYFIKGTSVNLRLNNIDGYTTTISKNLIDDTTSSININYKSNAVVDEDGTINLLLADLSKNQNLFKDLVLNGALYKDDILVKNFDITFGETLNFSGLDKASKYYFVFPGFGSAKDGIYYGTLKSDNISFGTEITKNITISYLNNLSDLNKVKFNISGLKNDLLNNQNVNFIEENKSYIFIENLLKNDYYYFPKNLKITPALNNISGYSLSYSPELISGTNDFNITYTENVAPKTDKIIATYWCGWGGNTSYGNAVGGQFETPGLNIDEISDIYNTIVISFIITENETEGITPALWLNESLYPKAELKQKISELRAKGKNIIFSIGGEKAHFKLGTSLTNAQKDKFVNGIISIIEEYGANGYDLDVEASMMGGTDAAVFAELTKRIVDHFRVNKGMGKSFLLTMAPEWPYIIDNSGKLNEGSWYGKFFKSYNVSDISYIMYQSYNQGPTNGFNYADKKDYWLAISPIKFGQNDSTMDYFCAALVDIQVNYKEDATGLIYNKSLVDLGIKPEQIVIGLPAANGASGNIAYVCTNDQLKNIVTILNSKNISFGGFMNWSADFDSLERIVSGNNVATHYSWQFAEGALAALGGGLVKIDKGNYKITINLPTNTDSFVDLKNLKGYLKNQIDGTVKTFSFNLGESFYINSLPITGNYSLYLQGLGNPKAGIYFSPLKKQIPNLSKDTTLSVDVSYSSKLTDDKLYSVDFISTEISEENLQKQKISFYDTLYKTLLNNNELILSSIDKLTSVYSYTDNSLVNDEYKFIKNASDVELYVNPISVKSVSIDNKKLNSSITEVNFEFDSSEPTPPSGSGKVNATYYPLGWGAPSKITEIPEFYNIIILSFGIQDGANGVKLTDLKYVESEEFIDDWSTTPASKKSNPNYLGNGIKSLQAQGRKVLLSLGGESGGFSINNASQISTMVSTTKAIIDKFGLDGIDIDLEAHSISHAKSDGTIFGEYVKQICDYYRNQGKEFILTCALEYPYLIPNTNKTNFYIDFFTYLGLDYFDYFWPQLYNQYDFKIKGPDGKDHWVGNGGDCSAVDGMRNFIKNAIWAFTTQQGAEANSNYKILPFPQDKFAIAVPSSATGAGCSVTGIQIIKPEEVSTVWEEATQISPDLVGFMSWDTWADSKIDWAFGKAVGDLLGIPEEVSVSSLGFKLSKLNNTKFDNVSIKGSLWNGETKVNDFNIKLGEEKIFSGLNPGSSYKVVLNGLGSPKDKLYYSPIEITSDALVENEKTQLTAEYELIEDNNLYSSIFTISVVNDLLSNLETQKITFSESSGEYTFIKNDLVNNSTYYFLSGVTTNLNLVAPTKFTLNYKDSISSSENLTFTYTKKENPTVPTGDKLNSTYWCSWGGNGGEWNGGVPSKAVSLLDIPSCYNVIIYSFIETSSATNYCIPMLTPLNGSTVVEHASNKPSILELQAQGRKVLISIGGANGHLEIKDEQKANTFAQGVIDIIEEYNFDGIDIDLEGGSVNLTSNGFFWKSVVIMIDYFKSKGKDFWITAAPEWVLLGNNGFYDQLFKNIGMENMTVIWPQSYNQGPNATVNPNYIDGRWAPIGPNNMLEFSKAMIEMFVTEGGNKSNGSAFILFPQEKFAFGIPANKGAANPTTTGQYVLSPTEINSLWTYLNDKSINIKGFMNWSADWDALQNDSIGHKPWDTGNAVASLSGFDLETEDKYTIDINLGDITDKADFSNINSIKGLIRDKSVTPNIDYNFTITLGGSYKFKNAKSGHLYDIYIQGIGNPDTGKYYDVIISTGNTFVDNQILTLNYSQISNSKLKSVLSKVTGISDSSVINSQILSFVDQTSDLDSYFLYQNVNLKDNYNYKFLANDNTKISVTNPSGYTSQLDNVYIDSTKNTFNVTYSKEGGGGTETEDTEKTFLAFIESQKPSNNDFSTWPNKNHMNVVLTFILYSPEQKKSFIWSYPTKDYINSSWTNINNVDRLWASVGGAAAANAPWVPGNQQTPDAFLSDLKGMVDDFGLVGIDFDIEGENNLYVSNANEVWTWVGNVIKLMKNDPKTKNLKLSVTLPDPLKPGLNTAEINLLKKINQVATGNEKTFVFDIINKMVFDWAGENNKIGCELASTNLTKNCYTISMLNAADDLVSNFGITKEKAISMLGCTYMIGKIGSSANGCDDGGVCQTSEGFQNATTLLTAKGFKHFGYWHVGGDDGFKYWNAIHKGMYSNSEGKTDEEDIEYEDISLNKTLYGIYSNQEIRNIKKNNAAVYNFDSKIENLLKIPRLYNLIICKSAKYDDEKGLILSNLKNNEKEKYMLDSFSNPILNRLNPNYIGNEIKLLKSKGKKILISIGGENSNLSINTEDKVNELVEKTIDLIEEYSFDGIEIAFDERSIKNSTLTLVKKWIKNVLDYFNLKGINLIITTFIEKIENKEVENFYKNLIDEIGKDSIENIIIKDLSSIEYRDNKIYNNFSKEKLLYDVSNFENIRNSNFENNFAGIVNFEPDKNINFVEKARRIFRVPVDLPSNLNVSLGFVTYDSTEGKAILKKINSLSDLEINNPNNLWLSIGGDLSTKPWWNRTYQEFYDDIKLIKKNFPIVGFDFYFSKEDVDTLSTNVNILSNWVGNLIKLIKSDTVMGKMNITLTVPDNLKNGFDYSIITFIKNVNVLVNNNQNAFAFNIINKELFNWDGAEENYCDFSTKSTDCHYVSMINALNALKSNFTITTERAKEILGAVYKIGENSNYALDCNRFEKRSNDPFEKINATYYTLGWGSVQNILDIPDSYNVIICAFLIPDGNGGVTRTTADWKSDPDLKNQITEIHNNNRKVLISIGGASGKFSVKNDSEIDQLFNTTVAIIDQYGFEGIDIDLEAESIASVHGNSDGVVFAKYIKRVVDHYRDQGVDFWLTCALEYPYFIRGVNGTNFYVDFINYLGKDYFNYFWPQLYNQYTFKIKGKDGKDHYVGDYANGACIAKDAMKGFVSNAVWAFTTQEGASANSDYSVLPIPAEKFVIGVPSAPDGVSFCKTMQSINLNDLASVWDQSLDISPEIKGFMSWDSNSDKVNHNYGFGNTVGLILGIPNTGGSEEEECLDYDKFKNVTKLLNNLGFKHFSLINLTDDLGSFNYSNALIDALF